MALEKRLHTSLSTEIFKDDLVHIKQRAFFPIFACGALLYFYSYTYSYLPSQLSIPYQYEVHYRLFKSETSHKKNNYQHL